MARFLCVHGHFYQPPRENPWTDEVEAEASALPHHDWNGRITAECYAPNAAARLFDGGGRIAGIVSNYARMSFNFGPTLLTWLAAEAPAVYGAVLAADRAGRERFSGHGGAMAQAYNHVILPLANRRDKETQIVWGLRDFAHRFGRPAAGMWLPETAVDVESLDLMAAHGVRFTILEPHQARRVRALSAASQAMPALSLEALAGLDAEHGGEGGAGRRGGSAVADAHGGHAGRRGGHRGQSPPPASAGRHWRDATDGRIDPTRPYLVKLPSGRRITVFFYDGPIARAVAFERLLSSGEALAGRLLAAAPAEGHDRLVHVATDGETYGHHHRFGEMALAYALRQIEASGAATLTNYAEFLAAHPPVEQVEIVENSSWSCVHGVDRWREDCGCRIGGEPGWNQAWRAPLRQALDALRDEIAPLWETAAAEIFASPWQARDDYVSLLLDRSPGVAEAFLERHAAGATPCGARRVRAMALLEMQRHAMLMYTSCGWFFDDLAGLEAVQVLRYAARAAQLADELFACGAERALLRRLAWARSNDARMGSGRDLYEKRVLPSRVTPRQVASHYAVRSLFGGRPNPAQVAGHRVVRDDGLDRRAGDAHLAAGRLRVESLATGAAEAFAYGGLRHAGPWLSAGLRPLAAPGGTAPIAVLSTPPPEVAATAAGLSTVRTGQPDAEPPMTVADLQSAAGEAAAAFGDGDLARVVRLLDRHFGGAPLGLDALLGDERRQVLIGLEAAAAAETVEALRAVLRRQAPLRRQLEEAGAPPAEALRAAAELVMNADLRQALADGEADPRHLESLLAQADRLGMRLDPGLGAVLGATLAHLLAELRQRPDDLALLHHAAARAALARAAPFAVDLWQAQNLCHDLRESEWAPRAAASPPGTGPLAEDSGAPPGGMSPAGDTPAGLPSAEDVSAGMPSIGPAAMPPAGDNPATPPSAGSGLAGMPSAGTGPAARAWLDLFSRLADDLSLALPGNR